MSRNTVKQNVIALAYNKRGHLLAVGRNSYVKTHPLQARYALKGGNPDRIYLHAEVAALIRASKRGTVHKLVIVRQSEAGNYLCAKPCSGCQAAISDFRVKHVEHT